MKRCHCFRTSAATCVLAVTLSGSLARSNAAAAVGEGSEAFSREATPEECLQTAMQNNHRRPASRFAVAMAEAQHRQTLAGYSAPINVKGAYQRMDELPDFLFPASSFTVSARTITIPNGGIIPVPFPTPGGW